MRPVLAAALIALTGSLLAPAAALAQTPARSALSLAPPVLEEDAALQAAIAAPSRPEGDRARDVFRRPYESLTFWGLTPGMTIVEIAPGRAGWWRHILEPYAAATGGRYVAVDDPAAGMVVEDGSADFILAARMIHNWARGGVVDSHFALFAKALKSGGVLAVEQHRSAEGLNVADTAPTGYVPESYVIQAAQRAGLVLEARSELNANPADDHDHPFGVWTLPPTRLSAPRGEPAEPGFDHAKYDAIGESDRMTLKFVKPK
jgi:predicted methyltransferase